MDRKQKIAILKNYRDLLIAYKNEINNNELKPKEKQKQKVLVLKKPLYGRDLVVGFESN